jgi:hypothetical protein
VVKPLGETGGSGLAKKVEHPLNGTTGNGSDTTDESPAEAALSAFDELAAADFTSESSGNL